MKKNNDEYEEWYETHKETCSANHERSAGKFTKEEDSIRVEAANRRSLENTREVRMARRRPKITAHAATKAEEGTLYCPGIDDSV